MPDNMLSEILDQDAACESAFANVENQSKRVRELVGGVSTRTVHFLGMGSSYFVGLAAAPLWARYGWQTLAVPAAEYAMHPDVYRPVAGQLVIGVSRSGTTPETLEAVDRAIAVGARTIAISVKEATALAAKSDLEVVVAGGAEKSPAQTKSFSGHLTALQTLGMVAADDTEGLDALRSIPILVKAWLSRIESSIRSLSGRFQRVYVLGSAERWGLAYEGSIKLKECAQTETEGFQILDFRHGPLAMVDDETLVVGLVGDTSQEREIAVLRETAEAGATVVGIGENLDRYGEEFIALSFHSGLPERARTLLYLPPLQLLAYHRAVAKGIELGRIRNLRNLH